MTQRVKVIQLNGNLDSTQSQRFKEKIHEIIEREGITEIVLVDFKDVTFMDSSGLGALVLAFKAVRTTGRKLVVCSINEQVRILFELTGMDKVFEIFANQEEFNKLLSINQ
jgi:anti-sigma F factor antagonist